MNPQTLIYSYGCDRIYAGGLYVPFLCSPPANSSASDNSRGGKSGDGPSLQALSALSMGARLGSYLTGKTMSRQSLAQGNSRQSSFSPEIGAELVLLAPTGEVRFYTHRLAEVMPREWLQRDFQTGQAPGPLRDYVRRIQGATQPLRGETFTFELRVPCQSSSVLYRAEAQPLYGESSQHLGYLVETRESGKERTEQEDPPAPLKDKGSAKWERHEKMVALGTLAAGLAHEIGNPLASLSAVVQLLQREVSDPGQQKHLQTLDEQIERITRIVRQMLSFSRSPAEESIPTDVNDLVEHAVGMVAYCERARDVEIQSVPDCDLPTLRIMPQLFQQVLVNLLLNALDAVEAVEGTSRIAVGRALCNEAVHIIVEDNGVGMAPEQIERAFEPFYTTKPPHRGTGLGLAVSYRLIQRQGGDISIESTLGEGTRVTVSLPVAELSAESVEEK